MTHPKHPVRRTAIIAAAALACLTLGLVGCSEDADPIPSATAGTGLTTTEPSEPAPSTPSWQDKFTKAELAAYEAALDRWTEYESKAEPIWAAGQATPEAKALFKEYWPSPAWQIVYNQLKTYEQVEVKSEGTPTVLWSKPIKITVTESTGSVSLLQCVDFTTVQTTQWGKPVERVQQFEEPFLRTIELSRPEGYPWLIYEANEATVENVKRCSAEDA